MLYLKGTSKGAIQEGRRRAEATIDASISAMGMASGQREKTSIYIKDNIGSLERISHHDNVSKVV